MPKIGPSLARACRNLLTLIGCFSLRNVCVTVSAAGGPERLNGQGLHLLPVDFEAEAGAFGQVQAPVLVVSAAIEDAVMDRMMRARIRNAFGAISAFSERRRKMRMQMRPRMRLHHY